MQEHLNDKRVILVVGEEEAYYELLQRFSPDRYAILYAAEHGDASRLVAARCPDLVVISQEDLRDDVPEFLSKVRCAGAPVLGVTPDFAGPGLAPEEIPRALIDRLARDRQEAVDYARELVGERRRLPRVVVGIDVTIDGQHPGRVRDLSPDALRVETAVFFEEGRRVDLAFDWGDQSIRTSGVVVSCQGDDLQTVVFRLLDEPAVEALDRLVRKVLEVDHYRGLPEQVSTVGPLAWRQARRAERALRQTGALRRATTAQEIPVSNAVGLSARFASGQRLATWGVGELMEATELLRDRPVWLKVLREELRGDGPARARLEMEATAGSELAELPGVVAVLDFGSDGRGGLYYSLERLEGETLAAALAAGRRFGAREIARLGAQLSDTLSEASRRGHAHHDLCPDNVFLQRVAGGRVVPRLLGFAGDLPPAPADRTHAMGADRWPPEGPEAVAWDQADTYALCSLLQEAWNGTADEERLPEGAQAGIQQLSQVLQRGAAAMPSLRFDRLAGLALAFRECSDDLDATIAGPPVTVAWLTEATAPIPAVASQDADVPAPAQSAARPSRRFAAAGRRQAMAGAGGLAASVCVLGLVWASPWDGSPLRIPRDPLAVTSARSTPLAGARRSSPMIAARRSPPAVAEQRSAAPVAAPLPAPAADSQPLPAAQPETAIADPLAVEDESPAPSERLTQRQRRRWYLNRGRYLLDKGNAADARRALTRALRFGDGFTLRSSLARAHEELGQPRLAIRHLKQAALLAPSSWTVQLRLGRMLVEVGRKAAACRAFGAAFRRKPDHPALRDHHRRFCGGAR